MGSNLGLGYCQFELATSNARELELLKVRELLFGWLWIIEFKSKSTEEAASGSNLVDGKIRRTQLFF